MTDIGESLIQLTKGASIVLLGTLIGKFLALFGQIIIVRSLPPKEFGIIALAYTIVSAISGVLVLGAPQGAARLLAAKEGDQSKIDYLQSALAIAAISGFFGAIGVYLFRFQIQQLTDTAGLANLLSLFALFIVVAPIARVLIGGLRGLKRPTAKVLAKDIIGQAGAISILAGFLLMGNQYSGAVIYWLSIPILTLIAAAYFLQRSISLNEIIQRTPAMSTTKEFISYSWPLALSGSFVLLMSQLDVVMIGYFLDSDDVGLYKSIQPLKQGVLFILTSFTFLYLPIATEFFTQNRPRDLNTLYTTATKWIVTATFPIVLTCILFAQDIIRFLFSESYTGASTAFVILILGMFLRVFVGPNGATVQAINETQVEMYAALLGALSNFFLNINLIPRFGIEGAAIATGIGFIIFNSVEVFVIYNKTGVTPFSKNIVKPIILTTAVVVAIHYIAGEHSSGIIFISLSCLLFFTIHLLSVYITRSIDRGDSLMIEKLR